MMVVNDLVFRLLRKNATLLGVPDMSSRWLERWPSAFGWAGNNRTLRGATGPAVGPAVATVGFRPFRIRSASHNAGKSTPATWSVGTTNEVNLGPRPQVQLPDPNKTRRRRSRKTKLDDAVAKNKTRRRNS